MAKGLTAQGFIARLNVANPHFVIKTQVNGLENNSREIRSKFQGGIKLAGQIFDPLTAWEIGPFVAGQINIDDFSSVVAVLKETPWAIPASLNNLRGRMSFKIDSQYKAN